MLRAKELETILNADDNFDRNTNDVKSVITSSTDVSDDTAVLTNQILEMKKQAGVVKSDETTTEVAAVNPESVNATIAATLNLDAISATDIQIASL